MSASLRHLLPEFYPYASALVDAASQAGYNPRVTSTYRSHAEQGRLYRRFLAGQSRFPAAPPYHSAHEYGYALDLIVTPEEALAELGAWWEDLGGIWGGRFKDPVHFEYPGFSGVGEDAPVDEGVTSEYLAKAQSILTNPVVSFFTPAQYSVTSESSADVGERILRALGLW